MSKRLENFIKNNTDEFDDLEPGNDLWTKIEAKLPATEVQLPKREAKTFTLGFVMRVAALIIVVMAIGFVCYIKTEKHDHTNTRDIANAISPEYAKQQAHYVSLVETKRTELRTLAKNDPQLYKEFSGELAKMDSTYKKLNKDLVTSPDQESVLRAMIRNLQIQTEVLNQQLNVIEQFNQSKKQQKDHEIKNI
ncbi:MAG: hypothetical protein ABIN91_24345 [Mucilaginibacter sp.]|uniref:hypothetical protein n=1 Tax=Mucilaginibacter sp. TaxID=1882438 RepID=UPI0032661991